MSAQHVSHFPISLSDFRIAKWPVGEFTLQRNQGLKTWCCRKKDVKNNERSHNVYENKGNSENVPDKFAGF
jgi:hypothetical protein